MKKNLNFDYDEENDILLLSSEGDYKGTVEIYGLLVDFNKDFSVKGFEIPLATKFFSNFLEKEVTKKMLKEVKSVKLEVRFSKEVMWSYLDFDLNNEHVRMPFTMSNPNYSYA